MDFTSGTELLSLCTQHNLSISNVMLQREITEGRLTEDEIYTKLRKSLLIMQNASESAIKEPLQTMGNLIGGEAKCFRKYSYDHKNLCGNLLSDAITYGLSVMEVNASMGLIVAAPTAGSCGIIPGILCSLQKNEQLSESILLSGLLNCSAIGYLYTRNASVSGAQAGCQAEVGAASSMGASAIVELMGGTPQQSLHAASIAISNLLGLVCDPIGGLVEAPCQSRNTIGIANAFVCAQMALSGIKHPIPFDEMLSVMLNVGCNLSVELRETALGGNAGSPTGCAFKKNFCEDCTTHQR